MYIKIRIIGACGSGKSFIAKVLSKKYGINYYELDNLVWDKSAVNVRYPIEIRDSKLCEIINKESWIVEGVHYKWGHDSFKNADLIFIIKPNKFIRDFRVIYRFIKTRLGIEQWNYKQSLKNLFQMLFIWNRGYDKEGIYTILELTSSFSYKRVIVKNNQEILKHIEEHSLTVYKVNDLT
ncbi:hypothetical protein [Paenibacillus endoradicis]|uniref:hypothetical protein n=1 Tax=Paenibacillus endoradicis TaxID=2972487 RepID=UPI002158BBCB|nr:hypothetical protein [Paenibacillus endoradicis]MCR8656686.1 hypothetical protein [Paenibacillus endoradicis]